MEKFTKGEWCVSIEQITPTSNKTNYAVYTESFDVVSPMLGIRNVFDAHLISAAPDMYRALRDVVCSPSERRGDIVQVALTQVEVDAIRAALAKADGDKV